MKYIFNKFNALYVGGKEYGVPDKDVPNIFWAAERGKMKELEEAMKHWDINAQDENGMTALHHAAADLQIQVVDRLLKELPNGLNPFIKDRFGREASWMPIEVHGGEAGAFLANRIADAIYPKSKEDIELQRNAGIPEGSAPKSPEP